MSRQAVSRQTDAASELESFLDDESGNISKNLFDGLEEVAEAIDGIAIDLQEYLDELENEKEEFVSEIERLESRIDELEESE